MSWGSINNRAYSFARTAAAYCFKFFKFSPLYSVQNLQPLPTLYKVTCIQQFMKKKKKKKKQVNMVHMNSA